MTTLVFFIDMFNVSIFMKLTFSPFSILHKFIPMQVEPFKDQIQRPSWKRACNYPVLTAGCEIQDLPVLTIFIHTPIASVAGCWTLLFPPP